MTRLLLVDGNPLVYRGYYAPGTRNLKTSTGRLSGGFYAALRTILALHERFKNSFMVLCFDSGLSGRDKIFPGYKPRSSVNDGGIGKPTGFIKQLHDLHAFLVAVGFPLFRGFELEADDLISLSCSCWCSFDDTHSVVIVSSDRDYIQLVSGNVMLYDDRSKNFYGPAEVMDRYSVEPEHFALYRSLIGDKADSIPKVPGFGPVKAAKFIQQKQPITALPKNMQQILERNYSLVRLPKTVGELLTLSSPSRKILKSTIVQTLNSLRKGTYRDFVLSKPPDFALAESILDSYECRSLTAEDFCFQKGV